MQVFVKRIDLSATNPPVIAAYPDVPVMDRSYYGTDVALLSLPADAVQTVNQDTREQALVSTWLTDNADQVVSDEAERRIYESFTDYMQRTALGQVQAFITRFGWDYTQWEAVYQNIYTIAQQGWTYVNDVRKVANSMIQNVPTDPTDDSQWPPRIPVVWIPTT